MSTVVFAGVTLRNRQTHKRTKTRPDKQTELLSENIHTARSSKVIQFPKIFQCYTETTAEMDAVDNLLLEDYGTLTIDGVDYPNCYVYQVAEAWEVSEGSGWWAYSIEFRQTEVY